ncbi:MAG: hypothetical protein KI791_07680 [Cyclobacteriaceae bacterium]|nr:hypothetical protein [Cyclobacteriaceae bacterium SS2]
MKYSLIGICTCLSVMTGFAQSENGIGVYRPKIAEFSSETLMDYGTSSTSSEYGNASNEIERDRLYKAKLGIPLLIREDRMFGLQLKYYQQRFVLDLEEHPTDYDFYLHLNSTKYTSAGIRWLYKQNLKNGSEIKIAAGAEIKSDVWVWNKNSSKYFISAFQTWQKSSTTEIGCGLMVGQNLGVTNVYPIFIYQHDFRNKWTIDLMLPKYAAMRYRINPSNYIIAKAQLSGWRYNLTNALEGNQGDLTLRKADVQFSLSWEREIHDWLWFGADIGYNKNVSYYLAKPGGRGRDALIHINPRDAMYTKVSIFMVPPRKFFQ